jgi:hypothetical protein
METSNQLLSQKFSSGDFAAAYAYFSDIVEWNIVGNQVLKGKTDTINFCNKMLIEMAASELVNNNIIETKEQIVIEGNCRYFDAEGKEGFVNYCDIYRFENDKIKTITSYCI